MEPLYHVDSWGWRIAPKIEYQTNFNMNMCGRSLFCMKFVPLSEKSEKKKSKSNFSSVKAAQRNDYGQQNYQHKIKVASSKRFEIENKQVVKLVNHFWLHFYTIWIFNNEFFN